MAVAPGSSESNFGDSILVPVIFLAPLSLRLVVAEVPTIFDFGETNPPSCHSNGNRHSAWRRINDIVPSCLSGGNTTQQPQLRPRHRVGTFLPDRRWLRGTRRAANATRLSKVSALVRKSRHATKYRCSPILAFPSPSFLLPRRNSAHRCSKTQGIKATNNPAARSVLFSENRWDNEPICYNSLLHTKLFLLLLTSLLPLVFFPVFTTSMSSTSGKLPADCNVVGSSADGVATEVSRICFANDFIFFFWLPSYSLLLLYFYYFPDNTWDG